jgi:tRNA A-37 threonylcarbamoyl transferase component Bud32/DNA-binding beta-propeller fold protein YncE/tetratricopeptide (TPR) repeat protein
MPFTPGENVGPYRIIEQLGQGGMATVFKAYHAGLDRYVAIKVMHPAFKQDPTFLARFQREARVVAKLDHPNIVPIYDYAEHNGNPYLVMKFIEGETLKARLSRGPLTRDEGLRVVDAVGKALAYAHARGILHRDIKPSNILLCPDGAIYLADFGLARIAQAGESTLSNEMLLGTPHYISPEQARGEWNLDAGTDIYSFGVVLYEMVVGRVPFNADTPFSIIHDHIYTPLPLPQKINPRVPDNVQRILLKALAKDRADRYATVEELATSFLRAVSGPPTAAARTDAAETLAGEPLKQAALSGEAKGGAGRTGQPPPPAPVAVEANPGEPRERRTWIWVVIGLGMVAFCLLALIAVSKRQNGENDGSSATASAPVAVQTDEIRDLEVVAARATLAVAPDDPVAHFALAEAEARAGFPVLASREYRKTGEIYLRSGTNMPAAEALLKAVALAGGPEKAEGELVDQALRACFAAGGDEPQGLLGLLDKTMAEFPDWPARLSVEAHAFIAMGELPRARELIDKALAADPNDALTLAVQAEWQRKSGDEAGARRSAEAAKATGTLPAWLLTVINEALAQPPKSGLITIGGEGAGPGLFTDARNLGMDDAGRIYVGEYVGGRVQVFDARGKLLTQWSADREMPLRGMAVRRDGSVYTVQQGKIVLRDGMTGEPISTIAYPPGNWFIDVALFPDGTLLAAWYDNRDDLVVLNPAGEVVLSIPAAISQLTGEQELDVRVAAHSNGGLWALGVFSQAVFHYDAQGRFVNRFGSPGEEPGQLNAPCSITIDGKGRIYVGDLAGVQVFGDDGRFIGRVEAEGPAYGMFIDPGGRLWVANGTQVRQYEISLP